MFILAAVLPCNSLRCCKTNARVFSCSFVVRSMSGTFVVFRCLLFVRLICFPSFFYLCCFLMLFCRVRFQVRLIDAHNVRSGVLSIIAALFLGFSLRVSLFVFLVRHSLSFSIFLPVMCLVAMQVCLWWAAVLFGLMNWSCVVVVTCPLFRWPVCCFALWAFGWIVRLIAIHLLTLCCNQII